MLERGRRNTLRYPGYDYGSYGAVFVTICTAHRQRLFGEIRGGVMHLNEPGETVLQCWHRLSGRFSNVGLDEVVLMPDHLHGIIFLGTEPESPVKRHLLGDVIRSFKSASARAWADGVRSSGWEPYSGQLWERKFSDVILNSESPIDPVREYIVANPARWQAKQDDDMR